MSRRAIGLLAASALLVAPAGADAATLAGTTVVPLDEARLGHLSLPRAVTFDTRTVNATVSFSGSPTILGIALRRVGGDAILVAFRDSALASACVVDCGDPPVQVLSTGDVDGSGRVRLPAGEYQLYTLADAPGGTATLRFGELEGAATIATDRSVATTVLRLPGRGAHGASVFGASATLTSPGMLLTSLSARDAARAASRFELCEYEGRGGASAFAPTCPGSSTARFYLFTTPGLSAESTATALRPTAPAGEHGLGGNVVTAGAAGATAGLAAWLPWVPEAAARPSPQDVAAPVRAPAAVENRPLAGAPARREAVLVQTGRPSVRRGWIVVRLACRDSAPCAGRVCVAPGSACRTVAVRADATTVRLRLPAVSRRRAARRGSARVVVTVTSGAAVTRRSVVVRPSRSRGSAVNR